MSSLCPNCRRPIYSEALSRCGYCGAELPNAAQDIPPEVAIEAVRKHFEQVLAILEQNCAHYCAHWVQVMEQHRAGLYSPDRDVQKDHVISLLGRCHHQALGDALTDDMESYLQKLADLRKACKRAMKSYEAQAG